MNDSGPTPTLLVFTLGPECESARRRLMPAPLQEAELRIHRQGLDAALEAGRQAGFRLVVASPNSLDPPADVEWIPQRGCNFAERLVGAIRSLQEKHPQAPLVVVGTDTPNLDVSYLEQAVAWLDQEPGGVVLGPSHDGGFYLLATRLALDQEFAEVRWCQKATRSLLERALIRNRRPVRLLTPLRDLDRPADVEIWLYRDMQLASHLWLGRLLRALLARWKRPAVPWSMEPPHLSLVPAVLSRGPPT